MRAKFLDLTRVTTALALAPLLLVAAVAPLLLEAWLDQSPALAVAVVTTLCLAFTLNTATAVTSVAALAIGRPGLPAIYNWVGAAVNIVLAIPLTILLDAPGVLIATAAGTAAGAICGFGMFLRVIDLPVRDLLRSLDSFAVGLPIAALVGVAAHFIGADGRLTAALALGRPIPGLRRAVRADRHPARLPARPAARLTAGAGAAGRGRDLDEVPGAELRQDTQREALVAGAGQPARPVAAPLAHEAVVHLGGGEVRVAGVDRLGGRTARVGAVRALGDVDRRRRARRQ